MLAPTSISFWKGQIPLWQFHQKSKQYMFRYFMGLHWEYFPWKSLRGLQADLSRGDSYSSQGLQGWKFTWIRGVALAAFMHTSSNKPVAKPGWITHLSLTDPQRGWTFGCLILFGNLFWLHWQRLGIENNLLHHLRGKKNVASRLWVSTAKLKWKLITLTNLIDLGRQQELILPNI